MKKVIFGNLNFDIVNSHKIMKSKVDNETAVNLFNEFLSKTFVYKTFFGTEVAFEIENQDIDAIIKIDDILTKQYGKPDFIAQGSLRVWNEKDFYIVHGMEEKNYNIDVHIVRVSFKKTYLFMLSYNKYEKYVTLFEDITKKWNLDYSSNLTVADNKMMIWLNTNNYQYFINCTKHKYVFYSSKKKKEEAVVRMIPSWNRKGKYKSIQDLFYQLDSFFRQHRTIGRQKKRDREKMQECKYSPASVALWAH